MKTRSILTTLAFLGALVAAGPAFTADKSQKQAEIKKAVATSLDKFYKANPKIKGEVDAAPGYAVFTSYGLSFLLGGAGGSGLAHDKASGKDTYMSMAQASAGVQAGIAQNEVVMIFKSKKAYDDFVNKGWEFGTGAAASAGAGSKSAGGGTGEAFQRDATYYTMTKNGLEVGGNLAGSKYWKDKDLN